MPDIIPPVAVLEQIQKFKGVFWFNNNWLPSGMIYSTSGGSGSLIWDNAYVILSTGATSESMALVRKGAYGLTDGFSWLKKRFFGVAVGFPTYSAQNIHITTGYISDYRVPESIYEHIGFKLIDAVLYGTVGDGSNESTLELETLIGEAYRALECIFLPGVECRFFVDGVDKGVITTNLPSGLYGSDCMLHASVFNTEAVDKMLEIYECRTYQEE